MSLCFNYKPTYNLAIFDKSVISIFLFYPCENLGKGDFSITYDGMFDALDKATENEHFAEMVWHCFAEKDEYAKKWLTEQGIIGFALEGSE